MYECTDSIPIHKEASASINVLFMSLNVNVFLYQK